MLLACASDAPCGERLRTSTRPEPFLRPKARNQFIPDDFRLSARRPGTSARSPTGDVGGRTLGDRPKRSRTENHASEWTKCGSRNASLIRGGAPPRVGAAIGALRLLRSRDVPKRQCRHAESFPTPLRAGRRSASLFVPADDSRDGEDLSQFCGHSPLGMSTPVMSTLNAQSRSAISGSIARTKTPKRSGASSGMTRATSLFSQ